MLVRAGKGLLIAFGAEAVINLVMLDGLGSPGCQFSEELLRPVCLAYSAK